MHESIDDMRAGSNRVAFQTDTVRIDLVNIKLLNLLTSAVLF